MIKYFCNEKISSYIVQKKNIITYFLMRVCFFVIKAKIDIGKGICIDFYWLI